MHPMGQKFTFPCYGHQLFRLPPGSHEHCPIRSWEDDLAQMPGSANRACLLRAQPSFHRGNSSSAYAAPPLKEPRPQDQRESDWCSLEPGRDYMEYPSNGVACLPRFRSRRHHRAVLLARYLPASAIGAAACPGMANLLGKRSSPGFLRPRFFAGHAAEPGWVGPTQRLFSDSHYQT